MKTSTVTRSTGNTVVHQFCSSAELTSRLLRVLNSIRSWSWIKASLEYWKLKVEYGVSGSSKMSKSASSFSFSVSLGTPDTTTKNVGALLEFNHVCNTVHSWTDTRRVSYGILQFFSVWVQNHKQTLFMWVDDLFNVKELQWRRGDSVCLHGLWYMTCLYIWSAYWGERFPSSTWLPQEPYFTWVIKKHGIRSLL